MQLSTAYKNLRCYIAVPLAEDFETFNSLHFSKVFGYDIFEPNLKRHVFVMYVEFRGGRNLHSVLNGRAHWAVTPNFSQEEKRLFETKFDKSKCRFYYISNRPSRKDNVLIDAQTTGNLDAVCQIMELPDYTAVREFNKQYLLEYRQKKREKPKAESSTSPVAPNEIVVSEIILDSDEESPNSKRPRLSEPSKVHKSSPTTVSSLTGPTTLSIQEIRKQAACKPVMDIDPKQFKSNPTAFNFFPSAQTTPEACLNSITPTSFELSQIDRDLYVDSCYSKIQKCKIPDSVLKWFTYKPRFDLPITWFAPEFQNDIEKLFVTARALAHQFNAVILDPMTPTWFPLGVEVVIFMIYPRDSRTIKLDWIKQVKRGMITIPNSPYPPQFIKPPQVLVMGWMPEYLQADFIQAIEAIKS